MNDDAIMAALARLEAGQASLRADLTAMEQRLIGRINNAQEAVIERVRSVETAVAVHTELTRSGTTTMSLIASLLSDMARRVTDLEKKS